MAWFVGVYVLSFIIITVPFDLVDRYLSFSLLQTGSRIGSEGLGNGSYLFLDYLIEEDIIASEKIVVVISSRGRRSENGLQFFPFFFREIVVDNPHTEVLRMPGSQVRAGLHRVVANLARRNVVATDTQTYDFQTQNNFLNRNAITKRDFLSYQSTVQTMTASQAVCSFFVCYTVGKK